MNKIGFINNQIKQAGTQIVGVTFRKKDGTKRVMAFRHGIYADQVKGTTPEITAKINQTLKDQNMIRVGDMAKGTFRTVNLETVERLRVNGKTHTF